MQSPLCKHEETLIDAARQFTNKFMPVIDWLIDIGDELERRGLVEPKATKTASALAFLEQALKDNDGI